MPTGTFRLTKSLKVVQFDKNGKGVLVTLPLGADVVVLGTSAISGCLEISYNDERYNIFERDLLRHSKSRPKVLSAEA